MESGSPTGPSPVSVDPGEPGQHDTAPQATHLELTKQEVSMEKTEDVAADAGIPSITMTAAREELVTRSTTTSQQSAIVETIHQDAKAVKSAESVENGESKVIETKQESSVLKVETKHETSAMKVEASGAEQATKLETLGVKTKTAMEEETSSTSSKPERRARGDQVTRSTAAKDQQKRNSAHILAEFEDQARSFQEQCQLNMPPKPKKPRSPSPALARQSVGLDHLDNLVRLLEQLSQLRNENTQLKRRCAYLEDTKNLLQVKTTLDQDTGLPEGYMSLPPKPKPKQGLDANNRPRLPSAEDIPIITSLDEDDEELNLRTRQKRSMSTGSINVDNGEVIVKHPSQKLKILLTPGPTTKSMKQKPKVSKWEKVKKVLNRSQKGLDEDGNLRLDRDLSQKSNRDKPEPPNKEYLFAPKMGISESRSVDSGVGSGVEGTDGAGVRLSTSSTEPPPSPSRAMFSTGAVSDYGDKPGLDGVWMGPPGWDDSCSSQQSTVTVVEVVKLDQTGSQYLEVSHGLPRRSSSPSFIEIQDETKQGREVTPQSRDAALHRTSSSKSEILSDDYSSQKTMEKKLYRAAWNKMKDIIQPRKDSLKKKKVPTATLR